MLFKFKQGDYSKEYYRSAKEPERIQHHALSAEYAGDRNYTVTLKLISKFAYESQLLHRELRVVGLNDSYDDSKDTQGGSKDFYNQYFDE